MIVKEIDLFKGLTYEIMDKITDICSIENYPKDTVLFEKGEEANSLYILEEGIVQLLITNGGTISYSLSEPGDVFGWSCMVEGGRYTASCVCTTRIRAVKFEKKKLDEIFNAYPHVGMKILRRLAALFSKRLSNAYHDLLYAYSPGGAAS